LRYDFQVWLSRTTEILRRSFDNDEVMNEFNAVQLQKILDKDTLEKKQYLFQFDVYNCDVKLASILNKLDLYNEIPILTNNASTDNSIHIIENIALNFDNFAKQMRKRQRNHLPYKIEDEWDLQDIFHSILKLFFNNIIPEECTPSYAGGSSRMDFLIKPHKIILELKMTGKNLRDRQVTDQITIDIARYKKHPDCKRLIFFVYDPETLLQNPINLEDELSQVTNGIDVKIIVSPK